MSTTITPEEAIKWLEYDKAMCLFNPMTEAEAKRILTEYGAPANIAQHIEAINVALRVLGQDATMTEIWRWASDQHSDNDTP